MQILLWTFLTRLEQYFCFCLLKRFQKIAMGAAYLLCKAYMKGLQEGGKAFRM